MFSLILDPLFQWSEISTTPHFDKTLDLLCGLGPVFHRMLHLATEHLVKYSYGG